MNSHNSSGGTNGFLPSVSYVLLPSVWLRVGWVGVAPTQVLGMTPPSSCLVSFIGMGWLQPLIFVWLEELGYEMDGRLTPLVDPTYHSPLSPFPPFFSLQLRRQAEKLLRTPKRILLQWHNPMQQYIMNSDLSQTQAFRFRQKQPIPVVSNANVITTPSFQLTSLWPDGLKH